VSVDPFVVKILVLALCAAFAVIAGLVAGILTFAGGTGLPGAALAGGGAFVLVLPVALTVAKELGMP
jgi:hypothetical protein